MRNSLLLSTLNYLQKAVLFGLLLTVCTFSVRDAKASHAMGMDLTYVCLGGNTYEFTLNFYRDCAGAGAPGSLTININSL